MTAKGFDTDQSFMLVEIDGDVLHFQTISRARPARGLRDDHAADHRRHFVKPVRDARFASPPAFCWPPPPRPC